MALKDTTKKLEHLLHQVIADLPKAAEGNKAASQRVRTSTIQLAKVAKQYRKESVAAAKSGGKKAKRAAPKRKAKAKAKKAAPKRKKKAAPKRKSVRPMKRKAAKRKTAKRKR